MKRATKKSSKKPVTATAPRKTPIDAIDDQLITLSVLFEALRNYGERLVQVHIAPGNEDLNFFPTLIADKGDSLVAEIYAAFQSKRAAKGGAA